MLLLQNITYIHPNKDLLFGSINIAVNRHEKIALIGNNGTGKSTLLKIMAGILHPAEGSVKAESSPYYIPQLVGQYNHLTIAQSLGVDEKLNAFREILEGNATESNLQALDDDWTIEERSQEALKYWQLEGVELTQKMETLSGGQKTKVFLAGITIHQPGIVLLDEPSNHLDTTGRQLLYDFISSASLTMVVVSHDRRLLRLLNTIVELSKRGVSVYGGNYEFYLEQKQIESIALNQDLKSKEKALRKARETERETLERQQKLDARGKKKQEKAGVPRIVLNTLKNKAENSTSRMKGIHEQKAGAISEELNDLRNQLPDIDKIKFGFDNPALHKGKILVSAIGVNFCYDDQPLWRQDLSFQISGGDRLAVKGLNGSGKTTLIKIILGQLEPESGTIQRAEIRSVYIDQDYSLINSRLHVYEQAQEFNRTGLQEHEVKIRLNRFLFPKEDWDKPCEALSGGEKMRLLLCCLTIGNQAPGMIVLDEPTNNLDIQNVEILIAAVRAYQGTLIVVSHDEYFLEQIGLERTIKISPEGVRIE